MAEAAEKIEPRYYVVTLTPATIIVNIVKTTSPQKALAAVAELSVRPATPEEILQIATTGIKVIDA